MSDKKDTIGIALEALKIAEGYVVDPDEEIRNAYAPRAFNAVYQEPPTAEEKLQTQIEGIRKKKADAKKIREAISCIQQL